jgi:hypothetical protein
MPLRSPQWIPGLALVVAGPLVAQAPRSEGGGSQPASHSPSMHAIPSPMVRALRRNATITLDGKLDEPEWALAEPGTDFRQAQPNPGDAATQRTEIRILFDADALYLGARMFDDKGAAGVRTQLIRRDATGANSDLIQFYFDTFHNHLGRTMFSVNPSGVKGDAGQATEFTDPSWDPVWQVKTQVDSLGWTAEFRIPFSQLRFSRDSTQTWGMQVWRTVARLNEISMWSYWGPNEAGGPSRFGHIMELAPGRGASRRLEVLPYTVGRYQRLQPGDPADPFYRQRKADARFGADLKYLLTSNLTLDATINPDFGQVEVDPAVVNLSAFETFFQEKRPFFIEGSGTFGFGGFNCYFCSNVSSLSLFYSRRIGRRPQGVLPPGTSYAAFPDATSILGAAKVTGRTRSGFTVGILDAVTGRENATALVGGSERAQEVEPFTNYFVGRFRQDMQRGNLVIGGIVTSVARNLDDPLLIARLNRHSESVGIDWSARWKNRSWSLVGNVAFTNNAGDPAAIQRLQTSSARYFQRPDRGPGTNGLLTGHYDPTLTSLRGLGGYTRFGKDAGRVLFETAVNWRTPGFEANDVAFNTRSDYIWGNANLALSLAKPTRYYRNYFLVTGAQAATNFDGDRTDTQVHAGAFGQLRNYWNLGTFAIYRPALLDDRLTRGGPVVKRPASMFYSLNLNTDARKRFLFSLSPSLGRNTEGYGNQDIFGQVRVRAASNVSVTLSPAYSHSTNARQYVGQFADPGATAFSGNRYLFADIEQKTVSLETRLSMVFTPTLSFELYAQPFIASAHYSRFKEIAAPRSLATVTYGEDAGTVTTETDPQGRISRYHIDPDGSGPAPEMVVANPDFNLRSLRGNAVLRWEYRPGSTIYFVWTRTGSDFASSVGDLNFSRDLDALFSARTDNIFLVKVNYWLNR